MGGKKEEGHPEERAEHLDELRERRRELREMLCATVAGEDPRKPTR
jgi:hypothetical protein